MLHPEVLELIRQDQKKRNTDIDDVIFRLQEELAELIVAVSHLRKGRKKGISETIEECADVIYVVDELINRLQIRSQVETYLVEKTIERSKKNL